MDVTDTGIVMLFKDSQPKKADGPMDVTDLGITTLTTCSFERLEQEFPWETTGC